MDNEFSNFLEKMYTELKQELSDLKQGQERIENKIDTFKAQFEEHEVKDANRHIEILGELKDLHNDIITLEDVTSKNWRDIVYLKKAK